MTPLSRFCLRMLYRGLRAFYVGLIHLGAAQLGHPVPPLAPELSHDWAAEPAGRHPERVAGHVPLSLQETELWRQIGRG